MAQLVRGTIADRPWGRTFAAIGLRGSTGQLVLVTDNKRYLVAFVGGAVVGAASPLASDAAVRVALTGGLLSSTQVAEISRRQAAAPERDEIELIAEALRLGPEQALRLRRRVVAQRAARTFSIERGEFVFDEQITVSVVPGSELDIRTVVFLGARQNLSEARLEGEVSQLGSWFRLTADGVADLPYFGFSDAEQPVLDRLQQGASLGQLLALGNEPRVVRAVLYALVACNACDTAAPVAYAQTTPMATIPPLSRTQTPVAGISQSIPTVDDPMTLSRARSRDATVSVRRRVSTARPAGRRRADSGQAAEIGALIKNRLQLLAKGGDHYALLGLPQTADADAIRKGYFALARQLHPDRLSAIGLADANRDGQRLFAQVNTAFAVLSDPKRREHYTSILRRGGEAAVRAEQVEAEKLAQRVVDAEEAFRRGEQAIARDQLTTAAGEFARAMELNPDEPDYQALHAWALFCAAQDKLAIAPTTRAALEKSIARAPQAVVSRFYLGRVERMLGRDQDALRHFQEVLRAEPGHTDAATEARVIEARLVSRSGDKNSLFRRKR
ncbi:MAG: J domain-containing protein [Kofleriaceae bacterium]